MKDLYRGFSVAGKTRKQYLTISAAIEAADKMKKRKLGLQSGAFSSWAIREDGSMVKE